jgi:hypothetical protein
LDQRAQSLDGAKEFTCHYHASYLCDQSRPRLVRATDLHEVICATRWLCRFARHESTRPTVREPFANEFEDMEEDIPVAVHGLEVQRITVAVFRSVIVL